MGPTSADGAIRESNLEPHPTLDHNEFSWAHHHPSTSSVNHKRTSTEPRAVKIISPAILGLDVQPTLLRQKQHVAVIVAERFVLHGSLGRVDMYCQPFSQNRRSGATQRFQTAHKVHA
jgi:hypothetical protein